MFSVYAILHPFNDDGTPAIAHQRVTPPQSGGANPRTAHSTPALAFPPALPAGARDGDHGVPPANARSQPDAQQLGDVSEEPPAVPNEAVNEGNDANEPEERRREGRRARAQQGTRRARSYQSRPKRHQCAIATCGARFCTQAELDRHDRTHTGERPFVCDVQGCSKAFAQKGGLHRHKLTHTGEKPFKCPIDSCGRAFTESGNLDRHMRSHRGERPFACRLGGCGKAFISSCHQHRHERVHEGDVFRCRVCGLCFPLATEFAQHACCSQG